MALDTKLVKIKNLGAVITGGTPPTKQREYYGDIIPLIKPTDMVLGQRYIGSTDESLSEKGINKFKNKLVPANTPCIVTIGTIGKSCLTKERSLVNQAVNCVVVDTDKYDIMYIYYLMQLTIPTVKSLNSGTASGRENVSKSVFENIDVKVVIDKTQQAVIGQQLSEYDSLIENNNRRIAILEDLAQSLYREWFVNFRYPSHADNVDADGNPKLIDSPLGKIPVGWEVKAIKDIGVVNTGKTPSKKKSEYYDSADVPFLKTPDMHGAIFSVDIKDYLSVEGANSQKKKFIPANSICVSCIGARAGVVTITSEKVQTNQQINSVVLNDLRFREYFYLFAVSLHQKIHALGSSGATMTNVNKSKFEGIEVIVPPEDVIQAFNSAIASSFDLILNLQKRNKNLKKQRNMLLPKLISGQIELKD